MPTSGSAPPTAAAAGRVWAWRVVLGFGVVSLTADMVYEGARSLYGPLLAALGASAAVVGLVTGAGEAAALLLRLVSGPLADRTRRYWTLTILGYALTAVCVPLLALTPALGGAGLAVAVLLILAERLGKAVRSPAKSALLADAAGRVGMGRGLGVHKALDQIGAFAGPLLVAGIIAAAAGAIWPGLAALAVPGAVSLLLLLTIRARSAPPRAGTAVLDSDPRQPANSAPPDTPTPSDDPALPDDATMTAGTTPDRSPLPARFHWFSVAMALCTAGLVTFGLIAFHLVHDGVVATAGVPVLYAAAMAAGALAALATGLVYDRIGPWVLLILPIFVAAVPPLAFNDRLGPAIAGTLIWGAAVGLQDSTVKALVADLVPQQRRATAYGIFAAVQGAGALAGGAAAGALYQHSLAALTTAVAVTQATALLTLLIIAARRRRAAAV
jgi:MFS family permease